MQKSLNYTHIFLFFIGLILFACKGETDTEETKWKGQKPVQAVSTRTVPIQKQQKTIFNIGEGIFATNDFKGARLNGMVLSEDTIFALITPENTPINPSPWYAFKIWSEEEKDINLKLTYQDGVYHRYYPKLSKDGLNWERLDESRYSQGRTTQAENGKELPFDITMNLTIGPDTLWISAQELKTSTHVKDWVSNLSTLPYVTTKEIGRSREKRSIPAMKIGESDNKKMIFVLSRQHPPEVTGFLAMQSFVEMIASENETAAAFRQEFNTYVVPMANPDGADNGHWRHSSAGIDLNRDWANVNQPEIQSIQAFMNEQVSESDGKFYFAVDFHSTWEDIYYTMSPELKGNAPGLVPKMIDAMAKELSLNPNIRPGTLAASKVTSSQYFFHEFGAESLTYEIGDDTPRDLLKKKGEVSALKLMELLLEEK